MTVPMNWSEPLLLVQSFLISRSCADTEAEEVMAAKRYVDEQRKRILSDS